MVLFEAIDESRETVTYADLSWEQRATLEVGPFATEKIQSGVISLTSAVLYGDDLIVAGEFENELDFYGDNITANGSKDLFIASLNSSGEWNWFATAGGQSKDTDFWLEQSGDEIIVYGRSNGESQFGEFNHTGYYTRGQSPFIANISATTGDWLGVQPDITGGKGSGSGLWCGW